MKNGCLGNGNAPYLQRVAFILLHLWITPQSFIHWTDWVLMFQISIFLVGGGGGVDTAASFQSSGIQENARTYQAVLSSSFVLNKHLFILFYFMFSNWPACFDCLPISSIPVYCIVVYYIYTYTKEVHVKYVLYVHGIVKKRDLNNYYDFYIIFSNIYRIHFNVV
jgi:hypothetical protein